MQVRTELRRPAGILRPVAERAASDDGNETIQTIMLVAVAAIILLAIQALWTSADMNGQRGMQGAVAALVDGVLDGRTNLPQKPRDFASEGGTMDFHSSSVPSLDTAPSMSNQSQPAMSAVNTPEARYFLQLSTKTAESDGNHNQFSPWNPGHAALVVGAEDPVARESRIETTLGLYPRGTKDNFINTHKFETNDPRKFSFDNDVALNYTGDFPDGDYPFISVPVEITRNQLVALLDRARQPVDYQVFSENCVDFAVREYNETLLQTVFAPLTEYGIASPRKLGDQIIDHNRRTSGRLTPVLMTPPKQQPAPPTSYRPGESSRRYLHLPDGLGNTVYH